ncbi:hypothetical protein LUZ60_000916 [Juncus effusus]|nr:hypothetical protein LUZ60_000916 [Juncus effusus]
MAGMLPGVEFARKRCLRPIGSCSTRGSSFSVNRTESHLSVYSTLHRCTDLGGIAREAKERLDDKFRKNQRATAIKRHHSMGSMRPNNNESPGNLQREIYNSSKTGMRKFMNWSTKLGWKASEQSADCAVCLDEFKTGDILVHLPCAHRFHSNCVMPWLESSSQCPVCRTIIFSSST